MKRLIALVAALALSLPLAAAAQQTATEQPVKPVPGAEATTEAAETPAAETPAAEAPAAEAPAAEAPATEAPAAEAPPEPRAEVVPVEPRANDQPREIVKESHGDWDIVCLPDGTSCVMAQKGNDAEGREILEVRIRKLTPQTKGKVTIVAAIQIAVPIGVMLKPGLALQIDSAKPLPAAYQNCNSNACMVREAVDENMINSMKKGAKAVFTIIAPPNVKLPIDVSLKGFTAAYNSLKP